MRNREGQATIARVLAYHRRTKHHLQRSAFGYCQHDIGHGLAALRYAAAALRWTAVLLDHIGDRELSGRLGLDRERPGAALMVGPPPLRPEFDTTFDTSLDHLLPRPGVAP